MVLYTAGLKGPVKQVGVLLILNPFPKRFSPLRSRQMRLL
jgi:hypothetical protein